MSNSKIDNAQFFKIMTPDGEKSGSFLTNQVTLIIYRGRKDIIPALYLSVSILWEDSYP